MPRPSRARPPSRRRSRRDRRRPSSRAVARASSATAAGTWTRTPMIDEPAPTAASSRSAYSACERPAITSGRVTPSAASSAGSVSSTPSPNTMRRAIVSWTTLTSLRSVPAGSARSPRRRGRRIRSPSSASVTSIAVPKLVAVLMNASSLPSTVSRRAAPRSRSPRARRRARPGAGQRRELLEQRAERRVAGHDRLAAEPVEQVRAPLAEVARCAAPGRRGAGRARRTLTGGSSSCGADARRSAARRPVGGHQAPARGRRRSPGRARGRAGAGRARRAPAPSRGRPASRCANAGA